MPPVRIELVARRNWMTLDFDNGHRIWANWRIEDAPQPLTKVWPSYDSAATGRLSKAPAVRSGW